jgi:hypothetical protein
MYIFELINNSFDLASNYQTKRNTDSHFLFLP